MWDRLKEAQSADHIQRETMNVVGCDRLCDMQAIFLVEVFALNFAHRCGRSFSARFETMFDRVSIFLYPTE